MEPGGCHCCPRVLGISHGGCPGGLLPQACLPSRCLEAELSPLSPGALLRSLSSSSSAPSSETPSPMSPGLGSTPASGTGRCRPDDKHQGPDGGGSSTDLGGGPTPGHGNRAGGRCRPSGPVAGSLHRGLALGGAAADSWNCRPPSRPLGNCPVLCCPALPCTWPTAPTSDTRRWPAPCRGSVTQLMCRRQSCFQLPGARPGQALTPYRRPGPSAAERGRRGVRVDRVAPRGRG